MDVRIVLSKIVTLIYRTRYMQSTDQDDLIKTVLDTIKTEGPENNFGNTNTIKKLKDLICELIEETECIPKEVLLPRLNITLELDPKLYATMKEAIEPDHDDATNKRVITSIAKTLQIFYKEQQATVLINKLAYEVKFNRNKIGNFSAYLQKTLTELEPFAITQGLGKDQAVMTDVDFDTPETVDKVFEDIINMNNNSHIYKFGWQGVNRMTQGGLRRGETVGIPGLQHKYKTGFSLSLFTQLALHNAPIIKETEVGKKPLLLRISFEDSLTNNLQFIYSYLKAYEGDMAAAKNFKHLTPKDMSSYITAMLTKTGFNIKMLRVDPTQWGYANVFNKIIELEAEGYVVHVLMLDYLTLLPTTGCVTSGGLGTDKRDLLRRFKNFCSARHIGFITPLQFSKEVTQLQRNGVPEWDIVRHVAEKSYYADSKQLDQELDLEINLHLFYHKRKKYIALMRGKHRLPTVIDEEDKYLIYRFPGLNIPILGDLDKEDCSFKSVPKCDDTGNDANQSLVNELLGL